MSNFTKKGQDRNLRRFNQDVFTKVGSSSLSNIFISVGQYNCNFASNCSTYTPSILYLDNQCFTMLNGMKEKDVNFKSGQLNRYIYKGYRGATLFMVFPIGSCGKYNDKSNSFISQYERYTTLTKQQIESYATLSFTPQGHFMTSPIICDRIYSQNGICRSTDLSAIVSKNDPNLTLEKTGNNYVKTKTEFGDSMNWQAYDGYVYSKSIDKTGNSIQTEIRKLNGITSNFCDTKEVNFKQFNTTLKYIQGTGGKPPISGVDKKSSQKEVVAGVKRKYSLKSYSGIFNKDIIDDMSSDSIFATNKYPFFFVIQLSQQGTGKAQLSFGTPQCPLTLQFYKDYNKLNVGKDSVFINLSKDNRAITPYFLNSKIFSKNARCAFVYPSHFGISVQPGVVQTGCRMLVGNKVQSSQPIGITCKYNGKDYSNNENQLYKNIKSIPSLQDWCKAYKTNQNINIYEYNWQLPWNDTLNLTFDNTIGSFFCMPVFFLPFAKLRIYFPGAKTGKYIKGEDYPENAQQSAKGDCTSGPFYQYTVRQKVNDAKERYTQYKIAVEREYYGAIIFTTEYKKITTQENIFIEKNRTFIGNIQKSLRIPPEWHIDQKQRKKYYNQYYADSYYFDVEINVSSKPFTRLPLYIIGAMLIQKLVQRESLLKNQNGKFVLEGIENNNSTVRNAFSPLPILIVGNGDSSDGNTYLWQWQNAITQVSVTHNQQSSTGSITIDKYALFNQQAIIRQSIGGIRLYVKGGNENVFNTIQNTNPNDRTQKVPSKYGNPMRNAQNKLFTGFVTKVSTNDSFSSDTITLELQGLQKKLSQLQLLNPPFWDGDPMKQIILWLQIYGNMQVMYNDDDVNVFDTQKCKKYTLQVNPQALDYIDTNGIKSQIEQDKLPLTPISTVPQRPAVNFKTGTSVLEALKDVTFKFCNHRFVLQPDGKIYIHTQNLFSLPIAISNPIEHSHYAAIKPNLITTFSIQPLFNNLHNFVISASLRGMQQEGRQTGKSKQDLFKLNKEASQIVFDNKDNPLAVDIPWSKVITYKHEGFMSVDQIKKQHLRDKAIAKNYWLNLKITIPGNTNIWIYDTVVFFGIWYYVLDVSHSIDLNAKKFTTNITLCNCVDDSGNIIFAENEDFQMPKNT